ncbi:MAG TPA: hypothetical protein VHF23_03240 [Gaiellaceae bacterium]|nr:hypothetical protein [Gaiellaceae bacterium]
MLPGRGSVRWAVPVLAALALSAPACGGEEEPPEPPEAEPAPRAGYVETLAQAFDPVLEATGALADASTLDELEESLEDVEDAARAGVGELEAAEPPDDAAGAHEQLVAGLGLVAEQAADARAAISAARAGDLSELPELLETGTALGLEGLEQIREALDELRERGFDVGRIGAAG